MNITDPIVSLLLLIGLLSSPAVGSNACYSVLQDHTQWCLSSLSTKVLSIGQGNCSFSNTIIEGFTVHVIYNGIDERNNPSPQLATACCTTYSGVGFCISSGIKAPLATPPYVYEVSWGVEADGKTIKQL